MLDEARQRGREIGRMSAKERGELVAKTMFGKKADLARLELTFLTTMWGVGPRGSGPMNNLFIGTLMMKKSNREALQYKSDEKGDRS